MQKIIAIIGPSGSGKTHLAKELIEKGIPKCVTVTTRAPRKEEGEKDGRDYYFVTKEVFHKMNFIETTTYHGNQYGLSVAEIKRKLRESTIIQVVVDQNGGQALKTQFPNETKIVYLPITEEEMRKRMKRRGDQPAMIEQRIAHAKVKGEFTPPSAVDFTYYPGKLEELLAFIYH
ncbi:guanylate kinase [Enterococcus sp. LJL98]